MPKLVNKKPIILSFLLSLVVLLSLAVYFKEKNSLVKESGKKEEISKVVTTPEPEIKEDIKDGVYTNYEYGFSFEYPREIFDNVYPWKNPTGKVFRAKGQFFPSLEIKTTNYTEEEIFYNDCLEAIDGDSVNSPQKTWQPNYIKIGLLNSFCLTQVGPYGFGGSGVKFWTYKAITKSQEDVYFTFSWSEDNLMEFKQHRREFESVLKSVNLLQR